MSLDNETHFLVIDFDLRSGGDLRRLVRALKTDFFALHSSLHEATLEFCGDGRDVNKQIEHFAGAILALPPTLRSVWDGCSERIANVGIQAGRGPFPFELPISTHSLGLLLSIGAALKLSVYPPFVQTPDREAPAEAAKPVRKRRKAAPSGSTAA